LFRRAEIANFSWLLLLGIFLYAAVVKIFEHEAFRRNLSISPLLVAPEVPVIAVGVVLIELFVAVTLIWERTKLFGIYTAFFLSITYLFYSLSIEVFFDSIPCGCGGIFNKLDAVSHIVFNIFLTILAVLALLLHRQSKNNENILPARNL